METVKEPFSCYVVGTGSLAVQCGQILIEAGHVVHGMVSKSDMVKKWAQKHDVACHASARELLDDTVRVPFDYLFSIVNNEILGDAVLALAKRCCINYHDALLPRYAGRNATSWAIVRREVTHGITWHVMTSGIDEGDVLKQRSVAIAPDETSLTLNGKCYEAALDAFTELVDALAANTAVAVHQDMSARTYFERDQRPDAGCLIDWRQNAAEVEALYRALQFGLYPNPMGTTKVLIGGETVVISRLWIGDGTRNAPGTICAVDESTITVATQDREIVLEQMVHLDGNPMRVAELARPESVKPNGELRVMGTEERMTISKATILAIRAEESWIPVLATTQPATFPYVSSGSKSGRQRGETGIRSESVVLDGTLDAIQQARGLELRILMAAAFAAYVARVNRMDVFDLGNQPRQLREFGEDGESVVVQLIPIRFEGVTRSSLVELANQLGTLTARGDSRGAYLRDIFLRYPELREIPRGRDGNAFAVSVRFVQGDGPPTLQDGEQVCCCLSESGGCVLMAAADALDQSALRRTADEFATYLHALSRAPEVPTGTVEILSDAERHRIVAEWNATQVKYPLERCVHTLIEEQVKRTPAALAVTFEKNSISYSELNRRANRLANYLRKLGVGPETLVAVCMERSIELVVSLLAVMKAGGAYVPVDPDYPAERRAFMLEDAQPKVVLARAQQRGSFQRNEEEIVFVDEQWARIAAEGEEDLGVEVAPENLAYVIYTSGSTGRPKGVMSIHRGLTNRLLWMQDTFGIGPGDSVLQKTPFSFDVSVWEFFWPFITGARLVVARPGGHKDSAYLAALIQKECISTLHFVPSMLRIFLEEEGVERCASLKRVICSGEELTVDIERRFFERLDAGLHNLYGPTEASIDVSHWPCQRSSLLSKVPIGRPIANTSLYILDGELKPVPIGVAGVLHIGGVGLARGYLNRPELTAEKFVPNPFASDTGSRLYNTGDLACFLPDGNIEYLGRVDNQVKVRGFRIELGEIETALRSQPEVVDCVVDLQERQPGEKRLVAYLVLDQGTALLTSDLRERLRIRLPEYMVPAHFVFIDAVPLSPNGKVDRQALPAPDESRPALKQAYVAPHAGREEELAAIWSSVLRVTRIGVHDNFFDLGGDSILVLQLCSKAHQAGILITVKDAFEAPTIARMAERTSQQPAIRLELAGESEIAAVAGECRLLPTQAWFFGRKFANQQHWNAEFVVDVVGAVDVSILQTALALVARHHDGLRLRFAKREGEWYQYYSDVMAQIPLEVVELEAQSPEVQEASIRSTVATQHVSLDLRDGPLARMSLFVLAEDRATLVAVFHHLVVDGISWRVVIEELASCYERIKFGRAMPGLMASASCAQWVDGLTQFADGAPGRNEINHWLALREADESRLPVDFANGHNTEGTTKVVRSSLSVADSRFLLQHVPMAFKARANDLLIAAIIGALVQWTGRSRLLLDLNGHGREAVINDIDASRTLGWFSTIFPVSVEGSRSSDPKTRVASVREQLARTPHGGLGFGALRFMGTSASVRRSLEEIPRAEVSFNYLGQFDHVQLGGTPFRLSSRTYGPMRSATAIRPYLIEIEALVVNEELHLSWKYSDQVHKESTISELSAATMIALLQFAEHVKERRMNLSDLLV